MGNEPRLRARVRVEGAVQGVGFRPYVYRLACSLGLGGFVRNDSRGVVGEVEGGAAAVRTFLERLRAEAPPLAVISRIGTEDVEPCGTEAFTIEASGPSGPAGAQISADTATCTDCLAELRDSRDRRFRYPFINCTNCGPRFTIVRGVPYDRPLTTMAGFTMCDLCLAEYADPADRRFHAQPNACPSCGPGVRLEWSATGEMPNAAPVPGDSGPDFLSSVTGDSGPHPPAPSPNSGRGGEGENRQCGWSATTGRVGSAAAGAGDGGEQTTAAGDPVAIAATALLEGAIVAVKGIGGYHLACRADSEAAVARLRRRKHREEKPFALMVADLAAAARLVVLDGHEQRLLVSRERPIVLARRLPEAGVAPGVAPGRRELGVMLPYSPLHHLLMADAGVPLVMTSGNLSDEPIAFRDEDAIERLGGVADLFLLHNRPIETRTDDSIVRVVSIAGERRPMLLRRSRGYVPAPIELPVAAERPLLAAGPQLKNAFCLAKEAQAWVGPHIGDLENWETLRSFREGIDHFERLFTVRPEIIAHDLHPEYLSTKYARARAEAAGGDIALVGVQHHHAHLAAGLAEHGESGPAIGAIFDGTGYGTDGTVWGGEILLGDLRGFERAGHLWPVRMPGGEAAIREPWRMACAWLVAACGADPPLPASLEDEVDPERWRTVARLARSGLASPLTTSMGRLFDAVAALCGVRARVSYEGQAAIELEALADPEEVRGYRWEITESPDGALSSPPPGPPYPARPPQGGKGHQTFRKQHNGSPAPLVLDPRAVLRRVASDVEAGVPVATISARFHDGVADVTARVCTAVAARNRVETVVLSGGVFQNVLLLERTAARLDAAGLRVLVPEKFPPNDGGIAYGQAAIAAAKKECP